MTAARPAGEDGRGRDGDGATAEPGYARLARELAEAGLDTLFGVMGEANLDLVACLTGRHGVRYLAARHEAGAVAMADGFARSSGRIGFATVTCGPGLTNAITALVTAVRAHAPLLLVTGQLPLEATGRSQTIDHGALLAPTGANVVEVESAGELPGAAARAIRIIRETRRPAVLNVLTPVLDGPCPTGSPDGRADPPIVGGGGRPEGPDGGGAPFPEAARPHPGSALRADSPSRPAPPGPAGEGSRSLPTPCSPGAAQALDERALERATALLAGARRPVILAGRGAVEAGGGGRLRALADRLGAGLAASLLAHGFFSGHPRNLGVAGGLSEPETAKALAEADVIAAFGASLNGWTTRAGALGRDAAVIQVDRDPAAAGRATVPVAVSIAGDAGEVAERLLAGLGPSPATGAPPPRPAAAAVPPASDKLDPRAFCRLLDAALPRERTITVDAGHFFEFPTRRLAVPDERGYLFTIAFGTVGLGLATATGAAFGRPDRVSVAFVGDGGLMMSLPDLDIVARARPPMLIVVMNDGAYGAEVKHLADRGWDAGLARFETPSFAELARALGIRGVTVATMAEAEALRPELGRLSEPLLVDALIDPAVKADWMEVMHEARHGR